MPKPINGRTEEEIKTALRVCPEDLCGVCPYPLSYRCVGNLISDALALIDRLESRVAELEAAPALDVQPVVHARLIDADALVEDIKRAYCTGCDNYGGLRCRACPTDDAMDMVDDAPTVCVTALTTLNALRDAAYRDALERGLWRPDDTPMDGAQMIRAKAMELIQEANHGETTEALAEKLADVIIGALSFSGRFGIDLDAVVRRKMASDKGRAQGRGKGDE